MTGSAFDTARRGYDREQVDERLRDLDGRLAAAEEARRRETERASLLEAQLAARSSSLARAAVREPAPAPVSAPVSEGFGMRAEKVLRLAEELAAELRTQSAQEAAAVVEQARADAETHRQEVEQALATRAAQQDQEATRREVELRERAQQVGIQLAVAREKADEIRTAAQREAARVREEAVEHAASLRRRAEEEIRTRREDADAELTRVGSLRDEVRSEMTRLHELLGAGIAAAPPRPTDDGPESGAEKPHAEDPHAEEPRAEEPDDEPQPGDSQPGDSQPGDSQPEDSRAAGSPRDGAHGPRSGRVALAARLASLPVDPPEPSPPLSRAT